MQPVSLPSDKRTSKVDSTNEPIVISVGLLSPHYHTSVAVIAKKGANGKAHRAGRMYPLDQFTLDIFVFNQLSWTRRFEASEVAI
ncbi:hypothetical protein C8Q73DRAFT_795497 [Cubamyces lactineus]|nr:hypothetical protein C8Q73DRAFT_795497 [Cubamyces lactineus]